VLSNSPEAQVMREAEDIITLTLEMNEDLDVIIALLRQYAGPEWTERVLERALSARKAGTKLKARVVQFHPHKREPAAEDGGSE
jgi:hypothetical protein